MTTEESSMKLSTADLKNIVAPKGRTIMAISNNNWACARDAQSALNRLKLDGGRGEVVFHEVPAGTVLGGLGAFTFTAPTGKTWKDATPEETAEWKRVVEIGRCWTTRH